MAKQIRNIIPLFGKKPKPQFVISIPAPCDEKWSEMKKVDDCQRHCASCDRVLTDFSLMNDDELLLFFRHTQGKMCGRFRNDQLNRPLTPLPEKTTKAHWWKAAVLLPLTLFSKNSSAQQDVKDTTRQEQVNPIAAIAQPDTATPLIADLGHGQNAPVIYQWNPGAYDQATVAPGTTTGTYTISAGLPDCAAVGTVPVDQPVHSTEVLSGASSPGTEIQIGTKAQLTAPAKIPESGHASGFGNRFHALNPKEE